MIFRYGSSISEATTPVKIMRSSTATPAPRIMPHTRCRCGSPRHAIAITTALSPESRMLIHMILSSATQNAVWPMSLQPLEIMPSHVLGSTICPIEPTGCSSRYPFESPRLGDQRCSAWRPCPQSHRSTHQVAPSGGYYRPAPRRPINLQANPLSCQHAPRRQLVPPPDTFAARNRTATNRHVWNGVG